MNPKFKKGKVLIPESTIKKQVKYWLKLTGWFDFHILQGMGAYRGIPDRIAIKDGRVLFIEIKRPGGKQSEYQELFEKEIAKQGGEYILIHSLEELMEKIGDGSRDHPPKNLPK